jgi:hypothetical protein
LVEELMAGSACAMRPRVLHDESSLVAVPAGRAACERQVQQEHVSLLLVKKLFLPVCLLLMVDEQLVLRLRSLNPSEHVVEKAIWITGIAQAPQVV